MIMKQFRSLAVILIAFIFGSCGMSSSFNHQKHTSLKKIKPVYANVETDNSLSENQDEYIHYSSQDIETIDEEISGDETSMY